MTTSPRRDLSSNIKATIETKISFTQSRRCYGCSADSTISGEKLGRYRALLIQFVVVCSGLSPLVFWSQSSLSCPNLRRLRLSCVSFCVIPIFHVLSASTKPIFQLRVYNVNPTNETSGPQPSYLDSLELDHYTIHPLLSGISGMFGYISFTQYLSRVNSLRLWPHKA